jgi:hypothetical protein
MYSVFCLFAIGTVSLVRKNNNLSSLLLILIGGYAAIHMIVEIQTRYRFDILPAFFILMGYGIYSTIQFIKKNKETNLICLK